MWEGRLVVDGTLDLPEKLFTDPVIVTDREWAPKISGAHVAGVGTHKPASLDEPLGAEREPVHDLSCALLSTACWAESTAPTACWLGTPRRSVQGVLSDYCPEERLVAAGPNWWCEASTSPGPPTWPAGCWLPKSCEAAGRSFWVDRRLCSACAPAEVVDGLVSEPVALRRQVG